MDETYWAPNGIYPRLAYEDEKAAIDWLTEAFGFEVRERKENPDGSVLAWLELDGNALMVCREGYGLRSPRALGGVTSKTICYVRDVDAHYGRAVAAGAEIDRDLDDTPWGDRRYEPIDPEGHRWHFAQKPDLAG
jgi:uncharacterized glyoxalase superfamily protein PhnB